MIISGFMQGRSGRLLLVAREGKKQQATVILPPFAEEMNKCRHLISALMRQLEAKGHSSFLLDNYGCGDSEGDLDTATIPIWRDDLLQLLRILRDQGYQEVNFISVRFGTLLLFDLLNQVELPLQPVQIILWQPMFDTTKFWQQFIRIKIAETMAIGGKLSQKELEQQLNNGNTIEIAGYPISPAFYQSLLKMQTQLPKALNSLAVSWFETSQLDSIALPVQKMRDTLQYVCELQFYQLKADPYWQTNELADANELIKLTIQQLTKMPA
jgi:exosortase A-associated hydrolase 2